MGSERGTNGRFGGLVVPGVAAAGVLLGHWLTYLILDPNAHARTEALASSGHGYWSVAVRIGIALSLAALWLVAVRTARGRRAGRSRTESFAWTYVRLAGAQAVAFAVMELVERVAAHQSLATLVQGGLLPLGMAVQVLIAAAGTLVLVWFARAAERVATAIRRWLAAQPLRVRSVWLRGFDLALGLRRACAGLILARAPPS